MTTNQPLWAILMLFLCATLSAQNPHLYHFTVDDGLPSSFVYRTFQDSKGYIWLCTDMGIARYNGYYFEPFTTQQGLPYNEVWDFTEDKHGRIWLHTYMPYFTYYDYADNQIHTNNYCNYGSATVLALHEWQGNIWASFNDKKLINVQTGDEKILTQPIWGLNGHTTNSLLAITQNTIYDMQNNNIMVVLQKNLGELYKKNTVKSPFDESWGNEKRFIYTINDTIYYDTPTTCIAKSLSDISKTDNDHISRVDIVSDDKLLLVTHKSVFVLNEALQRLTEYDFLQNYDLNSVFEDREKNVWIATKNNGLYMLTQSAHNNRLFTIKNEKQDFQAPNSKIQSLSSDKQGHIWLASSEGYIYYLVNNTIHLLDTGKPFWGHIRQLYITPQNLLIVVCNNHTLFIDVSQATIPKRQIKAHLPQLSLEKPINIKKPLQDQVAYIPWGIKKVTIGKNNRLLLSSSQSIIELVEFDAHIQLKYLYNNIRNYALAEDTAEHIFVGTPNGIKAFYAQKIDPLSDIVNNNAVLSSYVSDMLIDKYHNLWVATNGAGVYYLTPQQQKNLLEHNYSANPYFFSPEIKSNAIKTLFDDQNGNIWAISNQGVYRITLPNSPKQNPSVRHYSTTQGLPTNETFSVYATPQTAYIGTNLGLAQLNIQPEKKDSTAPLMPFMYFTHIGVNKKKHDILNKDKIPVFSYKENNIDIGFVCLSYRSNRQIAYYYRIIKDNNINTPWQTTHTLQREFPLLPPASYRFEVKARDIDNTETPSIQYSFIIRPPWWQQTWFRLLVACILGILLWVAYSIRVRYVRKQEQARNEFAAMRLQVLQSQMNPHFMNNALNAIQLFIAKADSYSANEYLAKFAVLNRLYLEASRRRFIPLSEELQLLTTYLELEHLRFHDKFDYTLNISEQMVKEVDWFPAMLLQPLAENAINNGLLYLKAKGHLHIEVLKFKNIVRCIIDDNGIGRDASTAIKSKLKKTHQSRAMQIINELQHTVNALGKMHIAIDILDKIDENSSPQGTRVTITITYISDQQHSEQNHDE